MKSIFARDVGAWRDLGHSFGGGQYNRSLAWSPAELP